MTSTAVTRSVKSFRENLFCEGISADICKVLAKRQKILKFSKSLQPSLCSKVATSEQPVVKLL